MIFDKILGHDLIKKSLISSVKTDTVSHAYIFTGKKGVGKTLMATAFAHMLTDGSEADIAFVTNEKYDIKKVAFSAQTVRLARADMYTKPYIAQKRVFIFPFADTMTIGAQNALLKMFEEPPSHCVIILLAEKENVLLPTIRSRAVTIRFTPLDDDIIRSYILQKNSNNADIITRLANGSIGAAENLINNPELLEKLNEFLSFFKKLNSMKQIYQIISFMEREKAYAQVLLDTMLLIFRDTLLKNYNKGDTIAMDNVDKRVAVVAIEGIENCRTALSFNGNFNILISELLLNIWEALND